MSSTRPPDAVKRLFTEAFTARDIAEPLASFDAGASTAVVREFMRARDYDVIGVRKEGQITGYVELGWLEDGAFGQSQRAFGDVTVLDDTAPLLQVLMQLNQTPFAFVTLLGRVGGI